METLDGSLGSASVFLLIRPKPGGGSSSGTPAGLSLTHLCRGVGGADCLTAPPQCQGELSGTISTCKAIPGGPGGLAAALHALPPLQ